MTGSLIGYHPASDGVNVDQEGPVVDHRFGRVYGTSQTSVEGVRYYDAYPNGVEILGRTVASIGITSSIGPCCHTYNGQLMAIINGPSNSSAMYFLRRSDLSLYSTFGTINSRLDSDTFNIISPTQIVAIQVQGVDYVICNSFFTDGTINCVTSGSGGTTGQGSIGGAGANKVLGTVTQNHAALGSVPDGSGAYAFVLGFTKLGGSAANALYTATPSALTHLGNILPTDVDATWTNFTSSFGVAVDQTDGHAICAFATTDSVTNQAYIVKLHKTTAHVIWAIPVGSGLNYVQEDLSRCNIKNGRLHYLDNAQTLWTINTVAGTATTQALDTATLSGTHPGQCSEDVSDSIYWLGSWTEGTTHPNYLGDYMLTQGIHTGSNMMFRYFLGPAVVVPTPPTPAISRKRAWTFTLDGHVFYVLDLGGQGTFLYDDSTGEWSQFVTASYNQWNLCNGTMWGQRIVGGDLLTTDIWEMQPGALFDNGSAEITHITTGGLIKRNRVFVSCDAFRLNCSFGQLDDVNGATIQLSFSDDQGNTWVDMDTLSMVEGDTTGEVAWRSLGSFAAPGRIFRITDVGAFLRIDGADAGISNFDEDGAPPKQGG
jgi:hypothetical protein